MNYYDILFARKMAGGQGEITTEGLSVTENGTYTAPEGKAYTPVVVNVPTPEDSYQLKSLPTGAISTITDGSNLPMPKLEIAVEPQQDLHGYDSPWVGGSGKNKFDSDTLYARYIQSDGSYLMSISSAFLAHYNIPSSLVGVACVFSGYLKLDEDNTLTNVRPEANIGGTYIDGTIIKSTNYTAFTLSFTPTSTSDYICIAYGGGGGFIQMKELQLEAGSTATTWTPYENICPISGWTEANVTVADDVETPTVSNVYTIDLDGTRYGGKLDVVSGVLTVDKGYIASYNGETLPSTWISDRDVYVEGTSPTTGAQVVYELATPITYQLNHTAIKSLLGNNNIWADTGDVLEGSYFKEL